MVSGEENRINDMLKSKDRELALTGAYLLRNSNLELEPFLGNIFDSPHFIELFLILVDNISDGTKEYDRGLIELKSSRE